MSPLVLRRLLRLAMIASAAISAYSQTAQITGVVTDSSGAAVPGAKITLTGIATGVSTSAQTNESGLYRLLYLQPGQYRLDAESAGFRKFVQENVTLQVADKANVDIRLELGAMSEAVTVTDSVRIIETESAGFTQLVDQRTIHELPLNKREAMQLVLLAPGFTADRTFETGSSGDSSPNYFTTRWRVGGSRPMVNEVLLDGVSNTGADKSFMQYNPPVDVTQEFKIQANAFSAEYGRTSGPVISIVTKSGTNEYHGVLYEFHRNSALDANDFFANSAGRARAVFRRNLFGLTAGGPVVKNRLFFFGDYDGQRLSAPNTRISTVPTALQKAGDFSRTFDATGKTIAIYDPYTTTTTGNPVRQPFPGNVIPRHRFDPVSAKSLSYYPEPNTAGLPFTGANNYISSIPRSQNWNRWGGRLDYYLKGSNRVFGRYAEQKSAQVLPGKWQGVTGGGRIVNDWYRSFNLNDTHTFSPTVTMELRAGYAGSGAFWGNEGEGFDMTTLGLPSDLARTAMPFFPVFNVSDVDGLGGASYQRVNRHTWTAQAVMSKAAQRHFLKAGADLRWLQNNLGRNTAPSGVFVFNRGATRGPDPLRPAADAGHGFASFLLGAGSDGRLDHSSFPALQVRYSAFFVQDDWKATNRLTVNLGLRYSFEQGITERYNRMATLDMSAPGPLGSVGGRQTMGRLAFRDENNRNLHPTDWNNFEPRVGLALQLNRSTVIRSGYGVFFLPRQIVTWDSQVGSSTTTPWVASIDGGLTPHYTVSNPFPQGFNLSSGKVEPLTGIGADLQGFFANEPLGYMQQWDFSVQRQVGNDFMVEAAYWGSKGTGLQWPGWQLNQLPNRYMALGNALNQQVPNPFYGTIKTGNLAQPTISRRQSLLPYPQYNSVLRTAAMAGSSVYHGFTLKTEKRAVRNLGFTISYTAGKLIDDTSGQETWLAGPNSAIYDMENLRNERALSALDISQRLVIGSVYDLPFGKGRRFGSKMHPVLNAILGGWSTGVIAQFQRGLPVSIARNAVSLGRSAELDNPTIERWFDTTAFRVAEPFTYGNVGRFLPDVRTDGLKNFDISALKNFQFGERFRAQFRGEFINAFNTPQFGNPSGGPTALTFGRVTSQYNAPRQVQLGLKIYW